MDLAEAEGEGAGSWADFLFNTLVSIFFLSCRLIGDEEIGGKGKYR